MRLYVQASFRKRAIYYTTYPLNAQGRKARDLYFKEKAEGKTDAKFRWDYDLKPVIVVAILNFRFEHTEDWPSERFRSSYRLREDDFGEPMSDVLRFVFLELKRFRKRVWELETMYDKWIWLLGHMQELETIPENFTELVFKRLFLMSELGNFTAEEYTSYLKSLDNMGDYDNIIRTAAEDAHSRGLEEGKHAKAFEMARNLKALGVDISVIVQASGLTEEQVAGL
ncbi:MAG: Rpn family recombination-promoting nuclease/putative transposase [Bacteroidales bacterium]|nr:Rpn family recombination-promoting nuclease/putative transposase [Bacteroidales bacterium]